MMNEIRKKIKEKRKKDFHKKIWLICKNKLKNNSTD
ncbi:hypothetical protein PI23P_08260 [Polaribacter irgensii 23-P]|uniref:Uncharacterized protein n=1 Tax=Polaribacter irgensii 23-P TaxID=313594 RepID=A4BZL1_9FLAO|nr:hypothetical protein PI23P_08260 [Polaribacter irgensii 23-P]